MTGHGIQGRVDTSFTTERRDLFASGIAAEIGANAHMVWCAIKYFADYSTGEAWPGMRKLADITSLSPATIMRAVHVLIDANLLRVVKKANKSRGQTYVATERLQVKLGDILLCTVVIDYVPSKIADNLREIDATLRDGKPATKAFATARIIPGPGFTWNADAGILENTQIPAAKIPRERPDIQGHLDAAKSILGLQHKKLATAAKRFTDETH